MWVGGGQSSEGHSMRSGKGEVPPVCLTSPRLLCRTRGSQGRPEEAPGAESGRVDVSGARASQPRKKVGGNGEDEDRFCLSSGPSPTLILEECSSFQAIPTGVLSRTCAA